VKYKARIGVCLICRENKPVQLGTVHTFDEEGQPTPVLKVEVCNDCLTPAKSKEEFKKGADLI
jgi:hypothetical protein